jgi:phosphoglycerol transferase MdoB-like AlkP superfamily enzyme
MIFFNSNYLAAIRELYVAQLLWDKGGIRMGVFTDQARQLREISSSFNDDLKLAAEVSAARSLPPISAKCQPSSCPDIVIVHLESVFDPVQLVEYSNAPGYLELMDRTAMTSAQSGPLLVNTWGGGSWSSEFEVLCGVNHTLFGQAGVLSHILVAPFVGGCLPKYLKAIGYETHAIYTASWSFLGVGNGFKRYGIDDFIDVNAVGAPLQWYLQRDKFFVDQARTLLAKPSDRPRFIFVSTNWNHGPHGQIAVAEKKIWPFDVSQAGTDAALTDYITRLNDTFSEMARFEEDVLERRPLAVLFYGDHQPSFPKHLVSQQSRELEPLKNRITLYRMAKNFGSPQKTRRFARIEELPRLFLKFAGISLSPDLEAIALLQKSCVDGQPSCSEQIQRALRAALINPNSTSPTHN